MGSERGDMHGEWGDDQHWRGPRVEAQSPYSSLATSERLASESYSSILALNASVSLHYLRAFESCKKCLQIAQKVMYQPAWQSFLLS